MIYGIGIDLVEIKRIQGMSNLDQFAKKILSPLEGEMLKAISSEAQVAFLAKQFAAKEATVKALGTGFKSNVYPKDISVLRKVDGGPELKFSESLERMVNDLGIYSWHVSLADEINHAVAIVVLEKK